MKTLRMMFLLRMCLLLKQHVLGLLYDTGDRILGFMHARLMLSITEYTPSLTGDLDSHLS